MICNYLLEMNNDVKGKFLIQDPVSLIEEKKEVFLKEFSLVIVNEMPEV